MLERFQRRGHRLVGGSHGGQAAAGLAQGEQPGAVADQLEARRLRQIDDERSQLERGGSHLGLRKSLRGGGRQPQRRRGKCGQRTFARAGLAAQGVKVAENRRVAEEEEIRRALRAGVDQRSQ